MAQRWTGYTSGTEGLRKSVENIADRQNKLEILSAQLKSQKQLADERNILTKSLAKSRDDLTREQIVFAEDEKKRDDIFRSNTLDYRAEERKRADDIEKIRIEREQSKDIATATYRTAVLSGMITTAKQNSMANWGVDVLDEEGKPLPTTIVDPNDSKKRIPNPTLVARGANFSPDGTRLISTQEAVLDIKAQNAIEQTIGLQTEQLKLEKINEAKIAPIDPLLFDPEESDWWGFDEEDALTNLRPKVALWGKTVELMSVLPKNNAKRIHVLSSIEKLHNELIGKKYAAATGGLALESGKYGQIRSALASELESYIKKLGGEIDKVNGKDSGLNRLISAYNSGTY